MNFFKKYFHFFFFIAISLVLTTIWFHGGYLIALGESALPFYSLQNLFKVYGHVWTPISLGFYQTPVGSIPFFSYGLFFELLGLPGFAVQAVVFFTFNVLMLLNTYLLVRYLFKDIKNTSKKLSFFFGCLFYLLNMITLVSVWNRLQYPFILFYISLPLILFIYAKGIAKRKYVYAIYLGLVLLPFSMAFIAIPFMELLWGIVGLYSLFHIILNPNKKTITFVVPFLFACGMTWFFFNSWWLLQYFQYTLAVSHNIYTTSGNADTLKILSGLQGNLSYIFRLMNRDIFIKMANVWGSFYFTPLFICISYIVPILAFFPLLLKKKPPFIYFFLGMSLLVIFLIKGSAGPFGDIFLILFTHIKLLEVFRGAFEKFGLVLPIAYTPLIVFSLITITTWIKKKYDTRFVKLFFVGFAILLFVVLAFPFWNGWLFTYYIPHANNLQTGDYVKVPDFYKQADTYLNKDATDFRTVLLPIENDSVTYNWNGHGYTGLDYTNGLFAKSFVSLSFGVENLDLVISQFQDILFNTPQLFTNAMNMVDAKYLMIRKDIDYKYRATMNPDKEQQLIEKDNIKNLPFEKQFGQLFFYKNLDYTSKIYPATQLFGSEQNGLWRDIFNLTDFKTNDVILDAGIGQKQDAFITRNTLIHLTYPISTVNYAEYPVAQYADGLRIMPQYYRFLPGDKFYGLITLKEKIQLLFTEDQQTKFFAILDLTTKRLGEFHRLVLNNNLQHALIAQQLYLASLKTFGDFAQANEPILQANIQYIRYTMAAQKTVLDHLFENTSNAEEKDFLRKNQEVLQNTNIALGISPRYTTLFPSDEKTIVYRYSLANDETYSLELRSDQLDTSYNFDFSSMQIQVNNTLFTVSPILNNGFLDFGEFHLKKGINEIQIALPQPKNLATDIQGEVKSITGAEKIIHLTDFDRLSQYRMRYSYKVNTVADLVVRTNSDIDYQANGQRDTSGSLGMDSYGARNWTAFTFPFRFNRGASDVSLSFLVNPINTCPNNDGTIPQYFNHCVQKKNIKEIDFQYKNLRVERVFDNQMLLVKVNKTTSAPVSSPSITYTRVNPSQYIVDVKGATKPFVLVFSENFDFGWRATYDDTHTVISNDQHFLADSYANAWLVERKGNYKITLSYASEDLYAIGKVITFVSIFIGLIFIFAVKFKK